MKNLIKFIQNYNRKNLHDIISALQIFDDETDVGQGLLLAACMAVAGEAKVLDGIMDKVKGFL